ncbi:MAG: hypothetical protein ACREPE_12365, partial [Lysobacter sp.]
STPGNQPPADVASSVARLAVTRSDAGLERMLSQILLGVFAISSIVVVALYGRRWWQSVLEAIGGDTIAWLVAGAGCLMVSWMFGHFRAIRDASDLGRSAL